MTNMGKLSSVAAALALYITACACASVMGAGVYARDGKGNPVSWWVVFKLPMLVRSDPSSDQVAPTPCDCPPPNCSQLPTEPLNVSARATGLCYLYADSKNATLRHFRELGFDCLGQGGDDPLSHTLRHIQPRGPEASAAPYWAVFNDQLNGIAQNATSVAGAKRVCSGSDVFSAHAKGAVAFDGVDGGFYLQTSTPNFPDPSAVPGREDKLIPLGCQRDNNVQFAQHMTAMSVDMKELDSLGEKLQAARLCSGNFYKDLRGVLASEKLLEDGACSEKNANFSRLYDALLNASLPSIESSAEFNLSLRNDFEMGQNERKEAVYVAVEEGDTLVSVAERDAVDPPSVHVMVKTPNAAVPPWALVAETLQTDVSVASWWDGSFGIPNICAGDVYTNAALRFCLDDVSHGVDLYGNGSAKFNIENLIEANWMLPNSNGRVRWHLVGGSRRDGNHAKWAVSSARYGPSGDRQLVTLADLNMEGFPCSKACNGSQAGRGGSFFTLNAPHLHTSLTSKLIAKACPCISPNERNEPEAKSFEAMRMCRMGCWRKIEAHFDPAELPVMSTTSASFWTTMRHDKEHRDDQSASVP